MGNRLGTLILAASLTIGIPSVSIAEIQTNTCGGVEANLRGMSKKDLSRLRNEYSMQIDMDADFPGNSNEETLRQINCINAMLKR